MKNYMKKIIVGIFAFVLLFLGADSAAAGPFNGQSGDCSPTIGIGNYTTGNIPRDAYGCWTASSITAGPGDTINVGMYYHNNTNGTLTNVDAVVTKSSRGPANSYTFTGSMSSDQGSQVFGTVRLNLSSSQTLNYSSTHLMKGKVAVLSDTDTLVVRDESGINVGSVPPGWDDYGTIIFVYKVGTTTNTDNCTISNFTANGSSSTTISSGDSVNLSWNTNDCTSVTVKNPNGSTISNNLDGTSTVYPTSSGTYTINAYGNNGSPSRTVYVNVDDNNTNYCTISRFTANGSSGTTYITSGNAVNLSWDTDDCYSANITGPNGNISSNLSGSTTIYPTRSGTYTINAYGNNGSPSRTLRVNIEDNNNNYCAINTFTANGSTSTTIQSGGVANLIWNTSGCTSVSVSGPGISSNTHYGAQNLYPSSNAQYVITAYGSNGSAPSRTVYVTVNPVVVSNTCAVTTIATNVTQNGATLNGLLSNSTGASYFEYGTNVNLGSRTVSRVGSGAFTEVISGLAPNTNYYFRFVSQCANGLSYGSIETFRTAGTVRVYTPTTTIIQGTTVIGTESPIMLRIENRYQFIGVGDIVDYTVFYKNIGKTTLTRPVLQVMVPKGFTLINTSRGTYSAENNTLTVPLEDLLPNAEGVVYLQARVDSIMSGNAQIVTTAILVYTSPSGAQENAIAYVLNSPRDINVLGASAFWSGLWGIGLIGWLLILILILLIILLTRRYYGNRSVVHKTSPSGIHTTTTTNY